MCIFWSLIGTPWPKSKRSRVFIDIGQQRHVTATSLSLRLDRGAMLNGITRQIDGTAGIGNTWKNFMPVSRFYCMQNLVFFPNPQQHAFAAWDIVSGAYSTLQRECLCNFHAGTRNAEA
uniref:Uncharacterized protein n=1 Tax=Fusarium oxysporum (strain Fo5176) TaxID=660025 RepID=A0A0D2XLG4_FUSOF